MLRDRSRVLAKAFQGLEILEDRLCFTQVGFNVGAVNLSIAQSTVTNNGDTSTIFQPANLTRNFNGTLNIDITPTGFTILNSDLQSTVQPGTHYYNFGAFLNNDRINHSYDELSFNVHSGLIPFTYLDGAFTPESVNADIATGTLTYDNWGAPQSSPAFDQKILDGTTGTLDPYNDPADNPDKAGKTASLTINGPTITLTLPFTVEYTIDLPMYYNSGTNARAGNTSGATTDFTHKLIFSGTITATADIFTASTGAITGNVFSDATSAADSAGVNGVEGVTVYLDTNNNNVLDTGELSTLTDANGDYFFPFLSPAGNTYIVRHIVPDGYRPVYPSSGLHNVDIVVGDITSVNTSNLPANFGDNQLPGTITGNVYRDTNSNGQKDTGEPGIFAARVYVDLNNDGVRQLTEPTALTDTNGNYVIASIPGNPIPTDPNATIPTAYTVRHVLPGSLHSTQPLGGIYSNVHIGYGEVLNNFNFGDADAPGSISGYVYEDLDGSGTRQFNETLVPNARVYLDGNNNGVFDVGEVNVTSNRNGLYTFDGLIAGTYRIRLVVPSGYVLGSQPSGGAYVITMTNSQNLLNKNFGIRFVGSGFSGSVFDDLNDNQVRDFGEPGMANVRIFLDSTGDGKYNAGETTTLTDGAGNFAFTGIKPGRRIFYQVVPTGYRQTRPNPTTRKYYSVKITADAVVSGVEFGNTNTSEITGTIFNDVNADGARSTVTTDERGIGPWTVYIDANLNGKLDTGEVSTSSNKYGTYTFTGLAAGTYYVRQQVYDNWRITTPKKDLYTVVLPSAAISYNKNFGNTDSGYATGFVFSDRNFDGVRAKRERIASNTVYDDVNRNGRYDVNADELATFNTTTGYYYFNALSSGRHVIRVLLLANQNQSLPARGYYEIKVMRGQAIGGLDFGVK